jgi:hypothetical protein
MTELILMFFAGIAFCLAILAMEALVNRDD